MLLQKNEFKLFLLRGNFAEDPVVSFILLKSKAVVGPFTYIYIFIALTNRVAGYMYFSHVTSLIKTCGLIRTGRSKVFTTQRYLMFHN